MKYSEYEKDIDHLIEFPRIYDGWSVAVLHDGTMVNRWANDDDTGPQIGYERRYAAVQKFIEEARNER